MPISDQLIRELPIDGREIVTPHGTWVVRLQGMRVEAHSTMRIAEIQLTGRERFEATIKIPAEKLVVENREGEIDWLLRDLRDWLESPNRGRTLTIL